MKSFSMIAIAGPPGDIRPMKFIEERTGKDMFDSVHKFEMPDDYGEFPDTTGYNEKNFENIILNQEDPNVYKFMAKCLDCVDDVTAKKMGAMDFCGLCNIQRTFHWPRFGGRIFAVIAFVGGEKRVSSPLILHPYQTEVLQ